MRRLKSGNRSTSESNTRAWQRNVRMLNGNEAPLSGRETGIGSASIRIRYRTDVTTGDRVAIDGGTFRVNMALPNFSGRDYADLVYTITTV
ncbi:phage head closure protein [Burkholderia pseudomallei]|uniref:phage head closure protein n=1 Tax=Burkholderia pseudomallei TaxID=28450 RepID=UPI00050F3F4F|nr:phage head-tail joining family protein [Burkholderia pseudomallei]